MKQLNETDLKVAVIDHLYARSMLNDAVLINEMVVANWSRRADLAVANGRLWAFELKSDLDTLARLKGQVETYQQRFDKVVVVTTERYLARSASMLPESVGLWSVEPTLDGRRKVRVVRPGRVEEVRERSALLGFLLKTELVALLRSVSKAASIEIHRRALESQASELPVATIRRFVLSSLKARYAETFAAFTRARRECTQPESLALLSKAKLMLGVEADSTEQQCAKATAPSQRVSLPATARALDSTILTAKYGESQIDIPSYILTRRRPTTGRPL
ncbi:sce7726 family protein [Cupriavidus alkaliphilus]|uniref:Sce7726 family protein n=1 Tax=Cupriavidus alkaliphilus TaxID=942866 RepID=A0A7W4YNR5_9BURK|nr:sce7726 family protein [Cupriavidus alkaliphilus]MBB3006015.1 hypothetical protein [Cupriavidus alkaliphilus]